MSAVWDNNDSLLPDIDTVSEVLFDIAESSGK